MSQGRQERLFKVGDKVRHIAHPDKIFIIKRSTYKDYEGKYCVDTNYGGGFWSDWFTLIEPAFPTSPVKISSLPTEGMDLKAILDRYEKLDAAGLIIKED